MKVILQLSKVGVFALLGAGFLSGPLAHAATVPVAISGFAFQPPDLTINTGDTVVWTQKDATAHTSTSDTAGLWNSSLLSVNQTFSHTFAAAGTFNYHCTPHASFMKASVTVQAGAANLPPTIAMTSPSDGATLTDPNVTLVATASDPDGSIAQVQFFEGRTSLGTVTTAPFQVSVNLAVGTHSLSAQATDNAGAVSSSAPIQITVALPANTPPTVTLSSPTEGDQFDAPATINLQAQASDPDGSINKVEFFAGDTLLGTATADPFTFSWSGVTNGAYTLTAKATDNLGASTVSNPIHVQVNTVALPAPTLSVPVLSSDGLHFSVKGRTGQTYQIQSSADAQHWTMTQTITAKTDSFPVKETPPAGAPLQFYRVQQQ